MAANILTARGGTSRPGGHGDAEIDAAIALYNRLIGIGYNLVLPQGALLPAVATATTTSKLKTTNPCVTQVKGALWQLAASDNFWTPTGAAYTGVDPSGSLVRGYLLLVDQIGTATVYDSAAFTGGPTRVAGNANLTLAQALAAMNWGLGINTAQTLLPFQDLCIVGAYIQCTNGINTWTPGTSTTATGGGFNNYFIDGLPSGLIPQIANEQGIIISSERF